MQRKSQITIALLMLTSLTFFVVCLVRWMKQSTNVTPTPSSTGTVKNSPERPTKKPADVVTNVYHSNTYAFGTITDYYPLIFARHFADPSLAAWIEAWHAKQGGENVASNDLGRSLQQVLNQTATSSQDLCRLGREFFELGSLAEKTVGVACINGGLTHARRELEKCQSGSPEALAILAPLKSVRPFLFYSNQWESIHQYVAIETKYDQAGSTDIWHAMNLDALALDASGEKEEALEAYQRVLAMMQSGSYTGIAASKQHEIEIRVAALERLTGRYVAAAKSLRVLVDTERTPEVKKVFLNDLMEAYVGMHNDAGVAQVFDEIASIPHTPVGSAATVTPENLP